MAPADAAKGLYTWTNGYNSDTAAEACGITRSQLDRLLKKDMKRGIYNERVTGKAVDTEAVFQRMTIQDAKVEALTAKVEAMTKLVSELSSQCVGLTVRKDLEGVQKRLDAYGTRLNEAEETLSKVSIKALSVQKVVDEDLHRDSAVLAKRLDYVEDHLTSEAQKAEKWLHRNDAPALAVVKK